MWQEAGAPIPLQYKLGQNFTTVRRFASYEDDRAKVRNALKTDFALDGAADLPSRAAVAAIISAWESCSQGSRIEGPEAKVLGVTRPVTQTDRMAMKVSYEKSYGTIEDSVEPLDEYLSTQLEELESHEPCASPLSEVTSRKNARTMGIQTSVDTSGHVRIVKSKQKGSLPQGTEELRQVLKVEGNTRRYLAAKFRNREMLRDMTPRVWKNYSNFLLGERCFLMKIHGGGVKGVEGAMLRPPWHILLSFEYELRKEAVKKAYHENRPLKDTLAEVVKDPERKERYFMTSPIALQPRILETGWKRTWPGKGKDSKGSTWPSDVPLPNWKWSRKDGRGKQNKGKTSKGKGDEAGKSNHGLVDRTPDGREISFAFNAQGCDGFCGRAQT